MLASSAVPQHIAVIMDGNRRWAKQRGKPSVAGHKAGVQAIHSLIQAAKGFGIGYVTLFAFSSENRNREKQDLDSLLNLFSTSIVSEGDKLLKQNVRLHIIGDLSYFDGKLAKKITALETESAKNDGITVSIALNYGGRWDIAQASKKIAEQVVKGAIDIEKISESQLQDYMCLSYLPAPDLLIRTGGEQRISNFLLWQLAYTELYFTDIFWPDFSEKDLQHAVDNFAARDRRYGT